MSASNELQCWGYIGASGSGKGLHLKGELRKLKPRRLVVADYKDEYGEFGGKLYRSLEEVRLAMIKAGAGPLVVRFKSKPGTNAKQTKAEFEVLCRLVQAWGNCVFVAEELSNFTMASWAPPAWREMTTGGRHESVHIVGLAQNPALIDKTFLSNCTRIHVGPLRQAPHRKAVAESMDVPVQRITGMKKFQWIELNCDTGEVTEGWCYPPGFAPTSTPPRRRARGGANAGQTDEVRRAIGTAPPTNRSNGS